MYNFQKVQQLCFRISTAWVSFNCDNPIPRVTTLLTLAYTLKLSSLKGPLGMVKIRKLIPIPKVHIYHLIKISPQRVSCGKRGRR